MILHEKTKAEFNYTFEKASNTKKFYCICDYCGVEFLRAKRTIIECNQTVQKDSCGKGNCKKQKSDDVQLLKFGVKNYGSTKEAIEKRKKTSKELYNAESYSSSEQCVKDNLEKYGVTHHTKTEQWKNNIKQAHLENRGVDHHTKDPNYQAEQKKKYQEGKIVRKKAVVAQRTDAEKLASNLKREETNRKKYGYPYPMQSEEIKKKTDDYFKRTYGKHYSQTEECREKVRKKYYEKYGVFHYSQTEEFKQKHFDFQIRTYGDYLFRTKEFIEARREKWLREFGVTHYSQTEKYKSQRVSTCLLKYDSTHPPRSFGKTQIEMCNWLNSLGYNFELDNVEILKRGEIDMYDKNLKIAVEYCGLYWHTENSPQKRERNYHYNKYRECLEKGVRLLTVFEDEWKFRKKQCQNYIKSLLKVYDKKIFARKCKVKEITNGVANSFYHDNHISGKYNRLKVSFALYYEEDLVAVMSLGLHHRNNPDKLVLSRLCFKDGIQVTGGASKLFKACIQWAKTNNFKDILSWSDNRWSSGDIYKVLGFNLDAELPPDYSYVNIKKPVCRVSKQSRSKNKTFCPKELTEVEWNLQNGFHRIWDCGKKRWVFKL